MNTGQPRSQYRSDLGISMVRWPLLFAGALGAAFVAAWVLQFLFVHGWYLLFLVPMVAGGGLAGVLHLLVGWTHCRNHWLAGGLGLFTGLAAFLGYFYLCLLTLLPPGMWLRVDLLPEYIALRMQTDVAKDVGRPEQGNQPKKPVSGLNWFTFACELAVMAILPAHIAWRRSRRAYCRELGCWLQRETTLFPRHTSGALCEALENEGLEEFLTRCPAGGDAQTACQFVLEYVNPARGSLLEYPVYASIHDSPWPKPWYWPGQMRKAFLWQAAITLREVVALRPVFPKLANLLALQHAELRDSPPSVVATPVSLPTDEVAVITPVPDAYRRQVLSTGYALKVNLLDLIPMAFILVGVGLLALGGYKIADGALALGASLLVAGVPSLIWGIYTGGFCLCVYSSRWIERRLRAVVARRPDSLVDPRDANSLCATLIPRESFARVRLTMASDQLLLRIDEPRRELLLEGDCDRYRVPAGAIAVCEPQCFFHAIDAQHRNELWMVRLLIRVAGGVRELLLSVGVNDWRPRTNARRRQFAVSTCEVINALQGRPSGPAACAQETTG